jgi:alpha-2-macroglobulin-like protein
LRMPGGCFEQTSSNTYPNVLALDYMKSTKKLTPEIHAKAEGYIASGYQRLLTFEVQGGGFSWFGNAPANKILTSYGLMEFSDMAKVQDVDERVIQRTQQWLAMQQQPDGSWRPDASFINEGATNRYNSDVLRITAYIAWALETTGYQGPAVDSAKRYMESHLPAAARPDAYTLAVLANFATGYTKDPGFSAEAMRLLIDARTEQGDQAWWKSDETSMYATGASAAVETTGLAVQALLKQGGESAVAAKAMNYIVAKKDGAGTWGSTQATIMALRAMLLAADKGGATAKGAVEVLLNGKVAGRVALTVENNDLLHQFAFKDVDARSANAVEVRFTGEGGLSYQVAGRYFTQWSVKPAQGPLSEDPLSIDVSYDRTRLTQNQIVTATATVRNNLATAANMVMVDLGIPPGFDLLSEDLQDYREKSAALTSGRLEKYSVTPTQAVLYFDSIAPRGEFKLPFRLRAKYPIRARTFESRVYEYYAPDVNAVATPVQFEVGK